MSPKTPVQARVSRRFDAPAERIFDAWLSPELIGQWMVGPDLRDEAVVRIVLDARVGGRFSFVVRRGGVEIDHTGEYLTVERPRRLAFTWGIAGESDGESNVLIEITPLESGCELTLTHEMDPKWAEFAERSEAAWGKMLDQLAHASGRPGQPEGGSMTTPLGIYTDQGEARTLTFVRWLEASPERVWQALTGSADLAGWLGEGSIGSGVGGEVRLQMGDPIHGEVRVWEPVTRLEYTWNFPGEGPTVLRFELEPRQGGTELRLIHSRLPNAHAPGYGPGWHGHLDVLEAFLKGRRLEWTARFKALCPDYGLDPRTFFPE